MAVIIKIPTWSTFNKIPVGTPAGGLAALNAALGLSLSVGDINPVWPDLQDLDLGGGPLVRGNTLEALAQVAEIENAAFLEVPQMQLAVAISGEVEGFPVVFEIDDITAEVPATFPNRTHMVLSDPEDPESGVETVHTWETWGLLPGDAQGASPQQIGAKWYRWSQDVTNSGRPLLASQWVPAGLTVLTSMPSEE